MGIFGTIGKIAKGAVGLIPGVGPIASKGLDLLGKIAPFGLGAVQGISSAKQQGMSNDLIRQALERREPFQQAALRQLVQQNPMQTSRQNLDAEFSRVPQSNPFSVAPQRVSPRINVGKPGGPSAELKGGSSGRRVPWPSDRPEQGKGGGFLANVMEKMRQRRRDMNRTPIGDARARERVTALFNKGREA